ncbi:hypothetical protein CPC08DRAFT_767140 [Agrocybe pediades]|nr:hypothetical protein CPC08DRAFT_767140 [Agrocybe pediades]
MDSCTKFCWRTLTVSYLSTATTTTTAPPGPSVMTSQIIDDRNPSIGYFGEWGQLGMYLENNLTTLYTQQAGSYALFWFTGPADISVWGTIAPVQTRNIPPQVSFQVDSDEKTVYVAKLNASTQYRQMFFNTTNESAALPSGLRTLNMTSLVDGGYFFLDYLIVTPRPRPAISTQGAVISSGNSIVVSSLTDTSPTVITFSTTRTAATSFITSVTSVPLPSEPTTPTTELGPIIGGAAGGLAFIVLILVVIFCFVHLGLGRRLRRRPVQPRSGQPITLNRSPCAIQSQSLRAVSPFVKLLDDILPPPYEETPVYWYCTNPPPVGSA